MERKEEILFQKLVQSVENQIEENRPPFVKDTYDILLEWGYSGRYAKERIAGVLLTEVYRMETEKETFREERYCRMLERMIEEKESTMKRRCGGAWECGLTGDTRWRRMGIWRRLSATGSGHGRMCGKM